MRLLLCFTFLTALYCSAAISAEKSHPSVSWKYLLDSGPNLQQVGWLATRNAKDIDSSDWSIGCETLDRDQAIFSVYKEFVGELGAKHARIQSGWAKCEKQKGIYKFKWLDESVYGLEERGVHPWVCLCYGNPIYGSDLGLGTDLGPIVNSEEALQGWLKYVEATVSRYKGVVKEWEIWNEPFGQGKDYAKLVLPTAELIKKIQPDAVIIITQAYEEDRLEVLNALRSAGKLGLVKYWAYHPYDRNPDSTYEWVEKNQKLLESYHPEYELYQGECGCPAILEWTHALANWPWTEYSQAKWNLRRMAGDRAHDIRSSMFTIIDLKYPNMLQSFGLIRSNLHLQFIYKRPAFYATQHMMSFFDNTVEPTGMLSYQSNTPRKLSVAGFQKLQTPVVLLWYSDEIPTDDIAWEQIDVTIEGVTFKDPVYVEMITGKVFELDKSSWNSETSGTSFSDLPVWDSPMMIAERDQVNLR